MMDKSVLNFNKSCFANYINDIRKEVKSIPDPYVFPDGNLIQPVLSIAKEPCPLMLVGAFPSARFEKRNGMLIPVANNLSPFGTEEYFDGGQIRTQASRESLNENYFKQLGINNKLDNVWITDIVKVYLFPEKHIKNCKEISPKIKFTNTHDLFLDIAKASRFWLLKEIEVCKPKLIITLGEVAARVLSQDNKTKTKELLNGSLRNWVDDNRINIAHLGHPEIFRLNADWKNHTITAIQNLTPKIKSVFK